MKVAQRYERLAAYARDHGFPHCRGSAVQHWVKEGILPRAVVDYVGFGRRAIGEQERLSEHLLALCEYRYRHRPVSIHVVGLWLWLDGYPVSQSALRKGLSRLADLPTWASRIARNRPKYQYAAEAILERSIKPHVQVRDLAGGLAALMAMLRRSIKPEQADEDELAAVAEMAGLRQTARDRGYAATSPPTITPVAAVREAARLLNVRRMKAIISRTTTGDLGAAKAKAELVTEAWIAAADVAAASGHPTFAGLDLQTEYLRTAEGRALVLLAVLADPASIDALLERLVVMAKEWSDGAPLSAALGRKPRTVG